MALVADCFNASCHKTGEPLFENMCSVSQLQATLSARAIRFVILAFRLPSLIERPHTNLEYVLCAPQVTYAHL